MRHRVPKVQPSLVLLSSDLLALGPFAMMTFTPLAGHRPRPQARCWLRPLRANCADSLEICGLVSGSHVLSNTSQPERIKAANSRRAVSRSALSLPLSQSGAGAATGRMCRQICLPVIINEDTRETSNAALSCGGKRAAVSNDSSLFAATKNQICRDDFV